MLAVSARASLVRARCVSIQPKTVSVCAVGPAEPPEKGPAGERTCSQNRSGRHVRIACGPGPPRCPGIDPRRPGTGWLDAAGGLCCGTADLGGNGGKQHWQWGEWGGGQHLIQSPPSCGGDCSERGAAGQKLSAPGVRTELAVGGGAAEMENGVFPHQNTREMIRQESEVGGIGRGDCLGGAAGESS